MQFTLADLGTVADVAQKIDANPLTLAGRLAGLSGDEQRAGVPSWTWAVLGVVGAVGLAWYAMPKLKRIGATS